MKIIQQNREQPLENKVCAYFESQMESLETPYDAFLSVVLAFCTSLVKEACMAVHTVHTTSWNKIPGPKVCLLLNRELRMCILDPLLSCFHLIWSARSSIFYH